jgi:signal peptidase I
VAPHINISTKDISFLINKIETRNSAHSEKHLKVKKTINHKPVELNYHKPVEGQHMTATLKKLWKNEYVKTAVAIGLIALTVFGFWYGLQAALGTNYPLLAVESGSMCVPYGSACDGWTSVGHPFERTLHTGDLIIIQNVNPAELNADYPNSDIIVFHKPADPTGLIVHRIVAKQEINGKLYFQTKGDGNGLKWPSAVSSSDYDVWYLPNGVPEDQICGKVIMLIPWVGHTALLMRNPIGLPLIILAILLLVFFEFVVPLFRRKTEGHDREEAQTTKNGSSL